MNHGSIASSRYLKSLGYKLDKVPFIPISAWSSDNLIERSLNMAWYSGPTLLEALDNIHPPKRPIEKPLRVPIQDVSVILCNREEIKHQMAELTFYFVVLLSFTL